MSGWDFTPEEETQLFDELNQIDQRAQQYRATSSPQIAETAGSIFRTHPYAAPGTVLSTAKAVVSGALTREAADRIISIASANAAKWAAMEKPKQKKKSWWERNVFDKAKTASRWTMAGLNFIPQTTVGAVAQIFDENDSVDGWFISTDLGTLIKNDEVAGEGWFIGGRAAELQAQRAREYRGEIDGHAFTIGRGLATTFLQPGSKPYSILSGLVDAAAAIAVPSAPGASAVKGAIKGVSAQTGLRTVAGLAEAESAVIDVKKVSGWLRSSSGKSVVRRVVDIENVDEAMRIFPNVDDPQFWVDVVDADTEVKALKMLEDSLGVSGPRSIDDINISRLDDVTAYLKDSWIGRKSGVAKMMASVPGRHLVLNGGNPRDSAQSIRNMNNYLMLLKVNPDRRAELIEDFTRALSQGNGNIYSAVGEFQKVMDESLTAMGVPEEARFQLMSKMRDFTENKAVYGAGDDLGDPTNYGAKIVLQDGSVVDAPLATAGLQSEMLRQFTMILPDPRLVRRMMSNVGWIYGKGKLLGNPEKYRELRLPLSALEAFQQEIWRPITLMTGGYVLRNMTDSALRLSLKSGMKGGALHPLQWIQIAAYKRFRGDLLGQTFDPTLAKTTLERSADEFSEAVGQGMREGINPISRTRREIATKNWEFVRRSGGSKYRKGIQDEISLLHDDLVTKMLAQGSSADEIIDVLKSTTEGKRYLRDLQGRWSNRTFTDANGQKVVGTAEIIKADGTFNDFNIKSFIEDYAAKRLKDTTRDNPLLVKAVADGELELADGTFKSVFKLDGTGARVGYDQEWDRAVQQLIDSGADLKQAYKYRIEYGELAESAGRDPNVRRLLETWNKSTDYFFSSLYPKRSKYLMQSPAFRQFYYKQVNNLFDELDQAGFNNVFSNLQKAAKAEGKVFNVDWLARYVGNTDLAENMMKRFDGVIPAGKGRLSIDQLDSYAKGFALDETKKLFYNASEKSNFADILRIVAPFGSAWAEVMNSWGKIATTNPEAIRKVGVSVQGLRDADPDADGRGFFWKDPTTGEYVFNYPFSDKLGPLVSGLGSIGALGGLALGGLPGLVGGAAGGAALGAGLQAAGLATPGTTLFAPAKTLTMGFNFLPGVGPFVQLSASKVLGNKPEFDSVMKFVAPYGEPQLTVVPSWAQKLRSAIADPENDRLLGDITVDVMRVLQQTGEYNLADAADRERLEKDSIGRARTLLMMRALGQFVGPTRPDVDFKVETYNGDMFTREISKAFRVMQDEDYDTAVERFLNTFGDDAFLYVAGKSKSVAGGLDASTKFGQFERENASLFARYGDVAGFFAPVGENFDYQVYLRQLRTGDRRRLKPSELIEEAQAQVGRALYRNLTRQAGPNPNADQRDLLSVARKELIKLFPGFGTSPVDINKLPGQIQQVYEAAFDPITDGNPVAEGARAYLQIRDMALNQALGRGFTTLGGKQVADLRGLLRSAADEIILRYPEFERLYDRILFNEIDVDAGE